MTFSYSLALATNVHKVRNLIDDTNAASYQLEDEEIDSILTLHSSEVFAAAATCLRRIAASQILLAKRVKAGDYAEDRLNILNDILKVAETYDKLAKSVPEESISKEILTDFNYRTILQNNALRGETD